MHTASNKILFFVILFLPLFGATMVFGNNLRQLFERGEQRAAQGNYAEAVTYYEKVVEIDPDFAPVYNALGLAHLELGTRLSDVVWLLNVAVDLDPNFADAYKNLCRVHYQAGNNDQAVSSCHKALEINPSLGPAQLQLAWVYLLGKNDPQNAIYYFEDIAKKIEHPSIYFGLGMAYSMNGDRVQVLEIITKLRSMGNDEFATQLENSIRLPYQPEPATIPSYAGPQYPGYPAGPVPTYAQPQGVSGYSPPRQTSTLVGSSPPPTEAAAGTREEGAVSGVTRIRLRGQLSNIGGEEAAQQTSSSQSRSSTTGTPGSSYTQPTTTAEERIRRLQQLRSGLGVTGGTTIKGSGY